MGTSQLNLRACASLFVLACWAALGLVACNDALGIRPPSEQILELDAGAADASVGAELMMDDDDAGDD